MATYAATDQQVIDNPTRYKGTDRITQECGKCSGSGSVWWGVDVTGAVREAGERMPGLVGGLLGPLHAHLVARVDLGLLHPDRRLEGGPVDGVPRVEQGAARIESGDLEAAHRARTTRPSSQTGPSDS